MSPADSGMYSASSAKSVDWDTRDSSLTNIETAVSRDSTLGSAPPSQQVVEEEEDVDTEGTLEGEEEDEEALTDLKNLIQPQPES